MPDIHFSIFVAMFFFLGGSCLLNLHQRYQQRQRDLPQRESYLSTAGLTEPACDSCGAMDLHEFGLLHGTDDRRIVTCTACKKQLYQFRRESAADNSDWAKIGDPNE
ncbi:MAG: hypothetical protein Q7J47_13395 [Azoarcus sp.]|nr:hypothetical protein [Azoarcus sp.]